MKRNHFYERVLYRAANGAILACICLFMPFFGISIVSWKNLLVSGVVLALLVGVSLLPVRGKVLCLLLAVICLGVPAVIMGLSTSYAFLQAYFQWCAGRVGEQEQWLEGFRLMQTMVITAAVFPIQLLTERFKAFKFILAFVLADSMLFCLLAKISMTHMEVVFMLLYIVIVYVEWLQAHWKKSRSGSLEAQILWLSPFFVIYLLLMSVMPAPENPYDWKWAKTVFNQVKESFLTMSFHLFGGGHEDFNMSLSGFSDDGELNENVRKDDREVMHIQVQRDLWTNVYLIGKVYDTFDGKQWQQEYQDGAEERFIDTLETLYAVRSFDDEYFGDYLRETQINIRYDLFNTGYVFAPLKARSIVGSETVLNYSFEGGDLLFEEQKGYGTEYNVVYYQLNMGEELFGQLLEAHKEPDEALWETVAGEYTRQTGRRITLERAKAQKQLIYENYLDQVILSQEVESYLAGITGGANTDLERLRAIERELSSYAYTTTPGKPPDKVTDAGGFLDYFLLESRQGYCTYFATAFVLLARAEGFPARYVQGFCVPMRGSRVATVLSSMAHAWPEVYVEDFGWIPFEPTPGYGQLRYTPWGVSVRDNLSFEESEEGRFVTEAEGVLVSPEGELGTDEESADQEPEDEPGFVRVLKVLVFFVPAILTGFALVLTIDNLIGIYRYRKMNPTEKLKVEVRKNLWILSWLGLKREEQETLQELHERGMLMPEISSLRFLEDYENVVYGGKPVGDEILERVKTEREQLWILIRKENKIAYFLCRIQMFLMRYR